MKRFLAAVITIIMMFSSGCVEKKNVSSTGNDKVENNIVYNLGKFPDDLLMVSNTNVRDKDLLLALFEGLIKKDETGNIVPGLAESWTIGKDDITYTFNIRDNVKWSDGSEITANDFVRFFSGFLNSKTDNIYAGQLYSIFGAEEYRKNKKSFNGVAVRAVDDKTLEIRLNSPCGSFLDILSEPVFSLRKFNDDLKNWLINYKNIVYTGPFQIDNIVDNKEITLVKNKFYWDEEEVPSDKIFITSIDGSEMSLAAFNNEKINAFINPPISESKSLIADSKAEVIPINSGANIIFNLSKSSIVGDESFRKALNLAIDRDDLLNNDLIGISRSAAAYIPIDNEDSVQSFKRKSFFKDFADADTGKKLLEDSKYNKKEVETIKLVYINDIDNKKLCEGIAAQIKDALDVNVVSKGYNDNELRDVIKNNEFDLFLTNNTPLNDDPISFLEEYISTSETNIGGYKNVDFDNMLLKAKLEEDQVKRDEILQKAEELLASDMPAVPIYFDNIILCKNSKIQNIYVTKEGNIKLDRAFINNNY